MRRPVPDRSAGFTLIELLVVLGILALVMVLGIPALQNLIIRSRSEGFAREASTLLQRTRLEAIKVNRPAVVHLDTVNRQMRAFVDVDGDFSFNPDPGEPPRTTDYPIARVLLPGNVEFQNPDGLENQDSVKDFTPVAVGEPDARGAYFRPDGSVDVAGAFRICDVRENCLEIRVDPPATGRVQVLKWHEPEEEWFGTVDPSDPAGYRPWRWN